MLFRLARGAHQEQGIKEAFGLTSIEDESAPMMTGICTTLTSSRSWMKFVMTDYRTALEFGTQG